MHVHRHTPPEVNEGKRNRPSPKAQELTIFIRRFIGENKLAENEIS